jgi:hypothetical protein
MTIDQLSGLLGVVVWPVVVVVAAVLLRRELGGLFGRVREIEGPGSLKVSLDAAKVEKIINEGRKDNVPPAAVAERIVRTATVLDRLEARILRALLDDEGRLIYNYQTVYYRSALEALLAKGYVRKLDKGFALSQEGTRITKDYLLGVFQRLDAPKPAPDTPVDHP